jgi:hypothetical protein
LDSLKVFLHFLNYANEAGEGAERGNMKKYSQLLAPDLTRSLADAGVLSPDAQDATITPAPIELLIRQVGGVVESSAFDLDCGHGTGFILPLHVAVNRSELKIWAWRLDLPWEDPQFQWLADPSEYSSRDDMYQFPGCPTLKYPRSEVINHCKALRRSRGLEGLLLAWSFESIPASYGHGATLNASIVLIDDMNHDFVTPVHLWVNRSALIDRKPANATTKNRRRIFDKRDPVSSS